MAEKKLPGIVISRKNLVIWIGLVVFFAAWMFVLGILVGRGVAPVNLEIGQLEKKLAELRAKMSNRQQAKLAQKISGKGRDSPQLGFYEALKSGKKVEPFKSLPHASVRSKPVAEPKPPLTASELKSKIQPVKTLRPKSTTKPKSTGNKVAETGQFTVQVAATKDAKSAEKLVAVLRKKGYKAYQIRTERAGKGIWYRIRVGAYKNHGAAGKILSKLKADKYNGMILRVK